MRFWTGKMSEIYFPAFGVSIGAFLDSSGQFKRLGYTNPLYIISSRFFTLLLEYVGKSKRFWKLICLCGLQNYVLVC
jgi:hypothetical protein